jgi:pyrroloquinoline-quinone synthase
VDQPLELDEFAAALRAVRPRYWDNHPFHVRLHAGGATADEVRRWVANRWHYQQCLARKNAAIVANCSVPEVRRAWTARIVFFDDPAADADWLALADAVGLDRGDLRSGRRVVRGVRLAVDAYLSFCRDRPWTEGVAASLTELFAPDHMSDRLAAWRRHYDWIKPDGYAYFERRIPLARRDGVDTLDVVLTHCLTRAEQDAAVRALEFKCDVLGAVLDAVAHAGQP